MWTTSLIVAWCYLLEGFITVLIGATSPVWSPSLLHAAKDTLQNWRARLAQDSIPQTESHAISGDTRQPDIEAGVSFPAQSLDDGTRSNGYIRTLAEEIGRARSAASSRPNLRVPPSYVDLSAYDEIVLTTHWGADAFLAMCVLCGAITASVDNLPKTGLTDAEESRSKSYPLRTIIVDEKDGLSGATDVEDAVSMMAENGVIPRGCHIDVLHGANICHSRDEQGSCDDSDDAADGDGVEDGNFAPFLKNVCDLTELAWSVIGSWRWPKSSDEAARLGMSLSANEEENKKVLMVSFKSAEYASEILLAAARSTAGQGETEGKTYGHVDLFCAGSACGGVDYGDARKAVSNSGDVEHPHNSEASNMLNQVNKVVVMQLSDILEPFSLPDVILPYHLPKGTAAVARAKGLLSSRVRLLIPPTNHAKLARFPDRIACAMARQRYTNEQFWTDSLGIGTAAATQALQNGFAGSQLVDLGGRMAKLISHDFAALENAGVRPGSCQEVFNHLNIAVELSSVAVAWALAAQDRVAYVTPPGHAGPESASAMSPTDGIDTRLDIRPDFDRAGDDTFTNDEVGVPRQSAGSAKFVAVAFSEDFRPIDDQEKGFEAFTAFVVRVLDEMP